jgi:LCP family protein required for cell wall assembly
MAIRTIETKPLWRRIVGWTLYSLFLAVMLAAGAGYSWLNKSPVLKQMALGMIGIAPPPPQEVFGRDSITILLLGCDEDRVYGRVKPVMEKARSDMMLVAKLDFKSKQITGVSIPRDTVVAANGFAEQKINGYHAIGMRQGGPELGKEFARRAVETLLPVHIDRVVVLDYKSLQEMVNIVGGVYLYVEKQMDYDDRAAALHIHLKPGRQKLDGYRAMGFVRFRHSDSDFERQNRQKQFLLAFKESVLKHIGSLPEVVNKAVEGLSNGLNQDEVAALAFFAKEIGGDNIDMGMVPIVEVRGTTNLRVDYGKLPETLARYRLADASDTRVTYRR